MDLTNERTNRTVYGERPTTILLGFLASYEEITLEAFERDQLILSGCKCPLSRSSPRGEAQSPTQLARPFGA
jgi:hypothetical protein